MPLLIYLPLTGYLREWLIYRLGSPVSFPHGSYENAVIARHITRLPPHTAPQLCAPDCLPITVPSLLGKPPHLYNYFPRRGQAALTEAINTLFTLDLWHSLAPKLTTPHLNESIEQWCKSRHIAPQYREAVRQRFYRIRQAYAARGIILGKKYKENV